MHSAAKWIWDAESDPTGYNLAFEFRRSFDLPDTSPPAHTLLAITADSWFRVLLNETWIGDGPCRSWPDRFRYDVFDVSGLLHPGKNELRVFARYFGIGYMHSVPLRGGLLASLCGGGDLLVATDESWEVRPATGWVENTAKTALQMEPGEQWNAGADAVPFRRAHAFASQESAPWRLAGPRDVGLLTREPLAAQCVAQPVVVRRGWFGHLFPVSRLLYPKSLECALATSLPAVFATRLVLGDARELAFGVLVEGRGFFSIDGRQLTEGHVSLSCGEHLLLFFCEPYGHEKDRGVRIEGLAPEDKLTNPRNPLAQNPWALLVLEEHLEEADDIDWQRSIYIAGDPRHQAILRAFDEVARCSSPEQFVANYGGRCREFPASAIMEDPHSQFQFHRPLAGAEVAVHRPAALLHDNAVWTVVEPSEQGDVQLRLDFGQQTVGFVEFELMAEEGVIVDFHLVEFIRDDGRIQFTTAVWPAPSNRNGFRWRCRNGFQRFLSWKRRSGRYLFIILRNQKAPVRLRKVGIVESRYPTDLGASFVCSDPRYEPLWRASLRTLELCMEDAYTDCPLYEQTLWVGDARNESLYALAAYNAEELTRRCLRLAAESLGHLPFVGAQVPSCWKVLLPAWSCLWVVNVREYFDHSGDAETVKELWPAVLQNLRAMDAHRDEHGLFSGPFWNMFDWTNVDHDHETVTHNTLFLIGALNHALGLAALLKEENEAAELEQMRAGLMKALDVHCWNHAKGCYIDSIHRDGSPSARSCLHTSFLGYLYDAAPAEKRPILHRHLVKPLPEMTGIGSPFAMQFYFEALAKADEIERLLDVLEEKFLPMIDAGATTLWEHLPGSGAAPEGFPTRSHAHAWSSCPIWVFGRLILGIQPATPGGTEVVIRPFVGRHDRAQGALMVHRGRVEVKWQKHDGVLRIRARAPEGVTLRYEPHRSHEGLEVFFEQD